MTQDDLGKHWGKTANYVYMLEAGQKPFPKKLEGRVLDLEGEVRKKYYPEHKPMADAIKDEVAPAKQETGRAPVVSWASAGAGGAYHDLAEFLDEYVETDSKDPNKYALIVDGESMAPEYRTGDRIVLAPNTEAQNGDVVVARLAESGQVYFKLYHESGEKVRLTSFHPAYPPLEFRKREFRFIHPVYQMTRKPRGKGK